MCSHWEAQHDFSSPLKDFLSFFKMRIARFQTFFVQKIAKNILKITVAKKKSKEYGFICLFTDGKGNYWSKVSRGLSTALNESLSSLEKLSDEASDIFSESQKFIINEAYRTVSSLFR